MDRIRLNSRTECGKILSMANTIIKGHGHIIGGALRSYFEGNIPKDIDVFCSNMYNYDVLITKLIRLGYIYKNTNESGSYISKDFNFYGTTLSIIKPTIMYGRYTYGHIKALIDDIDMNVCRLGLDWSDWIVTTDDMYNIVQSIENRKFHFVKIRQGEEARNIVRIKKYESYGYTHNIKGE